MPKRVGYARILVTFVAAVALLGCAAPNDGGDPNGDLPPTAPMLDVTPTAVKTFALSWTSVDDVSEYRLLEDPDGASGFNHIATLPSTSTTYSIEVFLPASIAASYRIQACNAAGCSDSEAVSVAGTLAEAVGYVKASNTNAGDWFGYSIALSGDGNTLAVGAPREASPATGIDGNQGSNAASHAGAVYVFVRDAGTWAQQAYVKASNTDAGDEFGTSVALSHDGSTLAVGARLEDGAATGIGGNQASNGAPNAGAAYVFVRDASTWTQHAYLKASNTTAGDQFGYGVALAADGQTLAVGAPFEDSGASGINGNQGDDSAPNAGAVYVFVRGGGSWVQQAYVKASNPGHAIGDFFGHSAALSENGDTLAVGATGESSAATGVDGNQNDAGEFFAGAAYVFTRAGGVWAQQAYVKASNTTAGDQFGHHLALAGDGHTLAVGAIGEDSAATGINGNESDDSASNAGAVYVFGRSGGAWVQQAYVKPSNTDPGDAFGQSVALSGDGSVLAVGAVGEDSAATGVGGDQDDDTVGASGAAYVYVRSHTAVWSHTAYVKASNPMTLANFGWSIALAADGATLAIGAYRESGAATGIDGPQDDASATYAGAAYLY